MTAFVNDDGEYLDYSGEDIGITKQCASFFEFKIKGDLTATLKIDNNSQNRSALGYYGPQQVNSPAFSKSSFNMVRDGNIISRGFIVIKDSDEENITIFYVSGNSNWFQLFQFNLKDIVFDDSYTVLISDLNGRKSATEGIVFPMIDWASRAYRRGGNYVKIQPSVSTEEGPPYTEVHPCLFLHSIVKYTGEYAGVLIDGDLMDDGLYKKIVLTPDGPDQYIPDAIVQRSYARVQNGPFGSAGAGLYDYTTDPNLIRLQTLVEGQGQTDASLYAWYAPLTGTYRIDFDFWINNLDQYDVKLLVNDVLYATMFNQSLTVRNKVGTAYANFRKGDKITFTVANTLSANYRLDYLTDNKYTSVSIKLEKIQGISPAGNLGGYSPVDTVHYVIPNAVCPDLKAIDLVKFLANYFSCVVSFNEYSNTVFLNKLANFKKEDAADWSEYFVSHRIKWETKVAKNNYIQTEEGTEIDIIAHDESNNVSYGGGNIETSFDSLDERDLFKIPFSGSWDEKNKSYLKIFAPYINFYDVELDQGVAFSGVSASGGGFATFTATFNEPIYGNELFYVVSTLGIYTGFAVVLTSSSATTNPTLLIDYVANDTGTIYKCSTTKVKGKPRMLICETGRSLAEIGGTTITPYVNTNPGTAITTGPLVWFDKPKVLLPIDSYHESLAIDSDKATATTISERYLGPIKKIFNNPLIEAEFTLPLSVFQNFDFGNYIYVETKDLTGYFIVQRIENYKDALTPVKCELLYAD